MQFGSIGSRNAINSLAKPYERSAVPIQDFANMNMYYPPNGYPSAPFYYGGKVLACFVYIMFAFRLLLVVH